MTREERLKVLKAYQPIAAQTIIDANAKDHSTSFYQRSTDDIQYFDGNVEFKFPHYMCYEDAFGIVEKTMCGEVERFVCI